MIAYGRTSIRTHGDITGEVWFGVTYTLTIKVVQITGAGQSVRFNTALAKNKISRSFFKIIIKSSYTINLICAESTNTIPRNKYISDF